MEYSKNTVYFSSSSQLPASIPTEQLYDSMNVGVVVNKETGRIEDVSIILLSDIAISFLSQLIIGYNLHEESVDCLIEKIEERFFGFSRKAICVALRGACERYLTYKEEERKGV